LIAFHFPWWNYYFGIRLYQHSISAKIRKLVPLAIVLVLYSSCGPSKQEIAQREKEVADSVAQVYEKKRAALELEKKKAESRAQYLGERNSDAKSLKDDLGTTERSDPLKYLRVYFKTDFNLFNGKDVVKGQVVNNATIAIFKNIRLSVDCYSKTDAYLGTESVTIYEYIRPKSSANFVHRFRSPKGTKKVNIIVSGASPHQ
jgi:hypothetical protein